MANDKSSTILYMKSFLAKHELELEDVEDWASICDVESLGIITALYRIEKWMEMIKVILEKIKRKKLEGEIDATRTQSQDHGRRWYKKIEKDEFTTMEHKGFWNNQDQKGEITICIYEKDLYERMFEYINRFYPL